MKTNQSTIQEFLALKRVAMAGISRKGGPASAIFKKLKSNGMEVIPIHPELESFQDISCVKHLNNINPLPEGIFLFTNPSLTLQLTKQCVELNIPYIWMHNMMGFINNEEAKISESSSVSIEAVSLAKKAGINVIAGSCPMQFIPPVDIFHTCIKWWCGKTGRLE